MTDSTFKILPVAQFIEQGKECRANGQKVVYINAVFDVLHAGHVRLLTDAKRQGDILAVSLIDDKAIDEGLHAPVFTSDLRSEALAALEFVDLVTINKSSNAVPILEQLTPDIYIRIRDNSESAILQSVIEVERQVTEKGGGEFIFTEDSFTHASTIFNILNTGMSDQLQEFTAKLKEEISFSDVQDYFDKIKNLKVLVLGEAIIDEYEYCKAIGKAGKEPVLVAQSLSKERFLGGSLAIANNIASFADTVAISTFLGDIDEASKEVQAGLVENVSGHFLQYNNRPTITKKRYVDSYLSQKLFEVYIIDDDPLREEEEQEYLKKLEDLISEFDVVVIADYGHGNLTDPIVDLVTEKAKFLAVNTQCNAGNTGMHTVSRYSRADYISISQKELHLELRRRTEPVDGIKKLRDNIECNRLTITMGSAGLLTYSDGEGFVHAPSLTNHVVDRIGSGDAVLALTSLLAAVDAPAAFLAFAGNLVGAHAVRTMGHRSWLDRSSILRDIEGVFR